MAFGRRWRQLGEARDRSPEADGTDRRQDRAEPSRDGLRDRRVGRRCAVPVRRPRRDVHEDLGRRSDRLARPLLHRHAGRSDRRESDLRGLLAAAPLDRRREELRAHRSHRPRRLPLAVDRSDRSPTGSGTARTAASPSPTMAATAGSRSSTCRSPSSTRCFTTTGGRSITSAEGCRTTAPGSARTAPANRAGSCPTTGG